MRNRRNKTTSSSFLREQKGPKKISYLLLINSVQIYSVDAFNYSSLPLTHNLMYYARRLYEHSEYATTFNLFCVMSIIFIKKYIR